MDLANNVSFAKDEQVFPPFLFDTLGPDQIQEDPIAGPVSAPVVEENQIKDRGGRPRKYDWDGCIAEIVRIADMDGLPSIHNELIRRLQSWFVESCGDTPADSEIKKRVSPIYHHLEKTGWKPRDG